MADRPIIFSAPMVLALLAGHKKQTRRLATSPLRRCKAGDRLWVRENFRPWTGSASGKTAVYAADDRWLDHGSGETFIDKVEWLTPLTPSIHMPRWASRLTLVVTAVRTEPLQAISDHDAVAEGIKRLPGKLPVWRMYDGPPGGAYMHPRDSYASLWRSLHGEKSWADNPDVLVITFDVVQANIDRAG